MEKSLKLKKDEKGSNIKDIYKGETCNIWEDDFKSI